MTSGDTDVIHPDNPVPSDELPQYGFLARLIGLPTLEDRLLRQLATDQEALKAALDTLRSADVTVDAIEPEKGTK